MSLNVDELKIGKKYTMNQKSVVYMGMFSDMVSPLAGFHLFVGVEDGSVRALRKTDLIESSPTIIVPTTSSEAT